MENTNWGEFSGGLVMPFKFSAQERQQISSEASKHIVEPHLLPQMVQRLEELAELYQHRKDNQCNSNNRRTTSRELQKIINGLTKAIDGMQSVDAQTQDSLAHHIFLTDAKANSYMPEPFGANPVSRLMIYRDAVRSLLDAASQAKYMRTGMQSYLASEILQWWFRYTDSTEFQNGGRYAWLDHKAGKCNSAVSVMLITKIVLAACGTHIEDPTNYIVQASESLKVMA